MWEASLERAKQLLSASAAFEALGYRCWGFLRSPPHQTLVWTQTLKKPGRSGVFHLTKGTLSTPTCMLVMPVP